MPAKKKPSAKASDGEKTKAALAKIIALTDRFCADQLNDEYAQLCRKLAEKLSRKRPSPISRGKPETWACGIIRVIGFVNFLDDRSFEPFLKFKEIDQALGVSESTGQNKSRELRKLLKISEFDVEWTLPSQAAQNPATWMFEIDGMLVDIRNAPRDIQEEAFKLKLIPFVPADQEPGDTQPGKTKPEPAPLHDLPLFQQLDVPEEPEEDEVVLDLVPKPMVFQYEVTLKHITPRIWRRFEVQDCTPENLHYHIQMAMGWQCSHMYIFKFQKHSFGNTDYFDDPEMYDSRDGLLSQLLPPETKNYSFTYTYDFGDDWEHEVVLLSIRPLGKNDHLPVCMDGASACPPEDIGGPWGYQNFLKIIADPEHPEHGNMMEWAGPFDPQKFGIKETTNRMRKTESDSDSPQLTIL